MATDRAALRRAPRWARDGNIHPLILDDRERASNLDKAIRRVCGAEPRIERLELGDILVRSRILIERKTANDLASSVLDGRLFRQISGLRASPFEPLVILEGEMDDQTSEHFAPEAFRGALLSICLDWRVPVIASKSVEDTAHWILALLNRLESGQDAPDWRWVTPTGQRVPRDQMQSRPVRRAVPSSFQRRKTSLEMLSRIPGIGPTKAEFLLDHFKTLAGVIAASKEELTSVRGLSHVSAAQIREAFHDAEA